MNNFVYHNPTKLVFGKGQIARLAKLIPAGKKIMITFGGGSVRRNGIYDQVVKALEGRDWVEFWGIEPNPSVETVREAIALGREHGSEFLLAVGGGSVIDGTKLIAAGLLYDGDPWEIVLKGQADAIVINGTLRVLRGQKRGKLLQYGERIWGITDGSDEERIERTIAANEEFFRSLGLSTHLSQEGIGEATIAEIERRFNAAGSRFGEARNVDGAMARRILEACL